MASNFLTNCKACVFCSSVSLLRGLGVGAVMDVLPFIVCWLISGPVNLMYHVQRREAGNGKTTAEVALMCSDHGAICCRSELKLFRSPLIIDETSGTSDAGSGENREKTTVFQVNFRNKFVRFPWVNFSSRTRRGICFLWIGEKVSSRNCLAAQTVTRRRTAGVNGVVNQPRGMRMVTLAA